MSLGWRQQRGAQYTGTNNEKNNVQGGRRQQGGPYAGANYEVRAVNVFKRSGLMKRRFQEGMNPTRFNNAWRTRGFQVNFMYKPVL